MYGEALHLRRTSNAIQVSSFLMWRKKSDAHNVNRKQHVRLNLIIYLMNVAYDFGAR